MFPTTPKPSNITIISVSPTLVSVAHSLKRQARRRGGQNWLIGVDYPPLSRTEFAPIWAFSVAQQGQYKDFEFIPPIYGSTSGDATGGLTANGFHSAGSTVINATGLTGTLKAGDFIKFTNHKKVYMLTANGSTTLNIEPALTSDVINSETITYTDVAFTVAFVDDTTTMTVATNQYVSYNIKLVEVVKPSLL